jgi:hypothetical protein
MGPAPPADQVDPEPIDAGKIPVTALAGASYLHQAGSFAMMRGGDIDGCVLGAFQVPASGDLASWSRATRHGPRGRSRSFVRWQSPRSRDLRRFARGLEEMLGLGTAAGQGFRPSGLAVFGPTAVRAP